ncbi:serine/threonine-protein kinase [Ahniella affigens]|nr:serine/threonine-protein kinase [Ahniella affigens]
MTDSFGQLQALFAAYVDWDRADQQAALQALAKTDPALANELAELLDLDLELRGQTVAPGQGLASLAALIDAEHSLTGRIIQSFRLCERLGQGGMGTVYRAERIDGVVKQEVAVKLMHREHMDADGLRRFRMECETLSSLRHPNIAHLIDACILEDGIPCLIMEYVPGVPLTEFCARHQLGLPERLRLFAQVCAAVEEAHRNLIVHRDLKPSNILVDDQGMVKLLDFGIAKSLSEHDRFEQTATALRFFSPQYAAPEQLTGDKITVACDIHALGLIAFELLSGEAAFQLQGLTAAGIERQIVSVPVRAPSSASSSRQAPPVSPKLLRDDLDNIVLKCLRKDPVERYRSVQLLIDELDHFEHGRPIQAGGGQWWYRTRKFVLRNRLPVAMTALVCAVIAFAFIVLVRQNQALELQRDRSDQALLLMKDAFAGADPIRAAGAQTNAGAILDAARTKLDDLYDTQPDLYANIALTIAEIDSELGRANQMVDVLARARQAARRSNVDTELVQQILILHADANLDLANVSDAKDLFDEALRLGPMAEPMATLMRARLLNMQGDYDQAIALLLPKIPTLGLRKPTDAGARRTWMQLAESYRLQGDNARCLAVLDDVLSWQQQGLPADHPLMLRTRIRRTVPLRKLGRLDEAIAESEAILERVVVLYGENGLATASTLTNLANALSAAGRNAESLRASERAIRIWQSVQGADHPNTLRAMFNFALALAQDSDRAAEADAVFQELLALSEKRLGENNELLAYYRIFYAQYLLGRERAGPALLLLMRPGTRAGAAKLDAKEQQRLRNLSHAAANAVCAESPGNPDLVNACRAVEEAPAPSH